MSLRWLDRKSILVELTINQRQVPLRGIGFYKKIRNGNNQLQIRIDESEGAFKFILEERDFSGEIESCDSADCEFRIRLDAPCTAISK